MSLITTIDGIPLYTTTQEALSWAVSNGLTEYHEHSYKEQIGYMGGETHEIAVQGPIATITPITIPIPTPTPTPITGGEDSGGGNGGNGGTGGTGGGGAGGGAGGGGGY